MVTDAKYSNKMIILDLDGTLIDSDKRIAREVKETFRNLGVILSDSQVNVDAKRDKYALANRYGFNKEQLDQSYRDIVGNLGTLDEALQSGEIEFFQDTVEVLDSLRRSRVELGLLTRASKRPDAQKKIQYFNLREYFGDKIAIVSGEETKYGGAQKLVGLVNRSIDKVYCVGDRAEDVLISEPLRLNERLNTKGIYVHRFDSPDPQLLGYPQVKSLTEMLDLVLRE